LEVDAFLKTGSIDPYEISLRDERLENKRAFKVGLLIFSFAFCALVFWAGWKEAAAYKECGLRGALTVGHSCSPTATQQHLPSNSANGSQ
jgi:hypothetical protein